MLLFQGKEIIHLILQSDIYKETIQQMIDKIFKIDISFFEGHASGDIQNRFNSVSEIYQFISITLISAIINAVTAIMCALVMMLQSFYLFQILFIIAAAQILIVYFLNKRARIKIKNYIADQSELQGKMVEILTNIQQIRCMRIDTILCKNIKGDYQHLIQRLKEKAQISDFIETIATTFTTISPMLLYTMGGFLIINSNLELGALVSFITLSTYFTGPFQTLSLIIPQISVLRETMLRINELMNYSDEIQSGKQSIGRFESISLKNVTFKYLGSNEPDLKGINITIKRGEKIAIVGESGSGKTTISKLLLNALTKYEGEILLNGYNINSIKREAIDHIFTIVTQVPMAISGTIRDNIDISHDLSDDEIYSCLKTAELENDVNKFPMKLNTFVGENGQNISGGQKQRIAIARALALKPEVLILDEATSNLDPITERKICDNLKKLHITQIIITHKELLSQFTEWANEMSRQIRHRSYERSLTQSDKKLLSDESVTDVDGVDISLGTELDSYDMDDSDSVANTDLLSKLSLLMDMGKKKTKYNVLNLNSKFTVDQKQTLEHVFDALYAKYTNAKANDIIQTIIDSF